MNLTPQHTLFARVKSALGSFENSNLLFNNTIKIMLRSQQYLFAVQYFHSWINKMFSKESKVFKS